MSLFISRALVTFLGAALLISCNSSDSADKIAGGAPAVTIQAPTPTQSGLTLNIVGGNNQTDAAGATFHDPLRVQLLDGGIPVSGRLVNFTVVSGSLTFGAASSLTDSSGMVQTYVTAGTTAGTVLVRALYNATYADFILTIADQTNATLVSISGTPQTANVGTTLALPFIVETRNAGGTPIANILVRFSVVTGNGRINSSNNTLTLSSDNTGRASVTFDVGTLSGANSVTAAIVSVPAQNTTFTATGIVPSASIVSLSQTGIVSSASSLSADGSQTSTLTLTIRDSYGNAIPNSSKAVVFSAPTGTLVGSVTAHANGTYTQTYRAPSSIGTGSVQISATVDGQAVTNIPAPIILTSGSVSLAQSTLTSSANTVVADGSSTVLMTLTLRDALGNQVTSGGETISFSSNLGTFIGSISDVGNGTYTQTLLTGTVTGTAVVHATVTSISGTPIPATKSIAFNAGAPDFNHSTILATPSTVAPNGTSTSIITVQLRDSSNNLATQAIGRSVTLTKTAGTWMGTGLATTAASDNGDGTYSAILIAPGSPSISTIQGTDNGNILAKTATVYFTNGAAGPSVSTSTITIVGANPQPADGVSTVTVKVTLKDSFSAQLASGGSVVVVNSTAGTKIGAIVDNGDGTYSQVLRAPNSAAIANITATTDGQTLSRSVTENYYGAISLTQSTITVAPASVIANGASVAVLYVNAKDSNGVSIPVGGETGIVFGATNGTLLGSVTDNANGTYSQQLRSTASASTSTITATKSGTGFSSTSTATFFTANNRAGLTIDCSNIATYQNSTVVVDSGTLTMNSRGSAGTCPSQFTFAGIILQNNAVLTHSATTQTQEYGLDLTANYMTIDATSKIDLTGKGYPMSASANTFRTQGNVDFAAPVNVQMGGSYGGQGASANTPNVGSNATYGSIFEPTDLGTSGATTYGNNSGAGGGRLKLTLTGSAGLTNSGVIRADGGLVTTGHAGGGGSGGSIWIVTTALNGSGIITANGSGTDQVGTLREPGGGGRVAVYYTNSGTLGGNFSYPTNILSHVYSVGALGIGNCSAGAGTVYLKSVTQTYGDFIVDNKGSATCTSTYGTVINSPSILANEAVDAHTLTKTGAFADSYSATSPFKFWYLDPNPAQNATPTKTDNQLYQITSATANVATTTGGDMTTVSTIGNSAGLVLQFDNIEIGDHTPIAAGTLRMLSYGGDLKSNDSVTASMSDTIPPVGIEYVGTQSLTINLSTRTLPPFLVENMGTTDLTVTNGTFNFNQLTVRNFVANTMTLNGSLLRTNANISLSATTATFTQNVGSNSIQATGNLDLSNTSTIYQAATTATLEHSLEIVASSINVAASSLISANGRGYNQSIAYNFRAFPNQDINTGYNGVASTAAGGSHAGRGGTAGTGSYFPAEVWGSFKNPYTSGGSGGWNTGYAGGGIIRLTATGSGAVTINGSVDARGTSASQSCGAGGSIYISCGQLSGSGTIDGRGGSPTGTNWAAGGGGRIAVYYNTLGGNFTYPANALANIKAWGGIDTSSNAQYAGAAGTVFMKAGSETYGKLIINNNGSPANAARTVMTMPTGIVSTGITYDGVSNRSTITAAGAFAEKYGSSNAFVGMFLNPNTAQNATSKIIDDTMFEVVAQTANTLTVSGNATTVAAAGNALQLNLRFDSFKLIGNSILQVDNGVILANDLDITSAQLVGTGSVETYPSSPTVLNPNGGTINVNNLGNSASLTLQNGTFVFPNNANVTTTGNLTFTSATVTGSGLSFNVTGNLTATGSTFNAGTITTTGGLNLNLTTVTATGAIAVGQDLLVTNSSTLNQTLGSSLTTTGNFTTSVFSTVSTTTVTVGGNLLIDGSGVIKAGNRVLTPFTTYNTVPAVTVAGTSTISNGSTLLSQLATATEEYYLYLTTTNLTVDATSFISADATGYHNQAQYKFRTVGNQDVYGWTGTVFNSTDAAGASYGGVGGSASLGTYWPSRTYGSFYYPVYLGTSGACWGNGTPSTCGESGGGAIRLAVSGTSQIDGVVSANGQNDGNTGGSGGSVYIQTGTLSGAGIIRANGQQNSSTSWGGGGGGRIAIFYTNSAGGFAANATRIANIQAYGSAGAGQSSNQKASNGTVYLKQSSQAYGDLILNNNGVDAPVFTPFFPPSSTVVNALTTNTLSSPTGLNNPYGNLPDFFRGFFVNPNIAQNATAKLSDDSVYQVSSNTSTTLTTATNGMDSVAIVGNNFGLELIFDNFEISGKAKLQFTGQSIRVISGDLSSNDATTFVQDGGITAGVVDLGPTVTWNTTGNASGTVTTQCSANHSCP
jgi:adhesin/invasin